MLIEFSSELDHWSTSDGCVLVLLQGFLVQFLLPKNLQCDWLERFKSTSSECISRLNKQNICCYIRLGDIDDLPGHINSRQSWLRVIPYGIVRILIQLSLWSVLIKSENEWCSNIFWQPLSHTDWPSCWPVRLMQHCRSSSGVKVNIAELIWTGLTWINSR